MKRILLFLLLPVTFISCAQLTHDVKYEVIGEGFDADITYTYDIDGNQRTINRSLPWLSGEFEMDNDTGDSLTLEVYLCAKKLSADVSNLTLNIYVDGKVKKTLSTDEGNADVCISQDVKFDPGWN